MDFIDSNQQNILKWKNVAKSFYLNKSYPVYLNPEFEHDNHCKIKPQATRPKDISRQSPLELLVRTCNNIGQFQTPSVSPASRKRSRPSQFSPIHLEPANKQTHIINTSTPSNKQAAHIPDPATYQHHDLSSSSFYSTAPNTSAQSSYCSCSLCLLGYNLIQSGLINPWPVISLYPTATIEYCMYCGYHCHSIDELIIHLQLLHPQHSFKHCQF